MRYLVVISFTFAQFFFCGASWAQPAKIDSLRKTVLRLRDTARIDCFYELAVQYLCKPNRDSATYFANHIYEESKRINYAHGLAAFCMLKAGIANQFYNDYSQMERFVREALKWFNLTENKKDIDIAYWQLGRALTNQSNYDEALTNLQIAYGLAQKEGYKGVKGAVFETMTDIYRDQGEYAKLLRSQQELIKMDRIAGDTGYYSFHELWVLGLMYRLMEEYSTALPFWRHLFLEEVNGFVWSWNQMEYAELLTYASQPDSALYYYNKFDSAKADIKDLRFFLVSKGEYYLFLKQYNAALPYFHKGLTYHRQLNDQRQIKRTLLDIAKTYAALGLNDSAINYARKGLAMSLQTKSKPLIRDAYEIIYSIYNNLHQTDSAYNYYQNYIAASRAVMDNQTRGKLAAYNYERRIELLDKEKQLQQQQLKQTAQQRKILIIGIAGLLMIAFIIIRYAMLKRKNEADQRRILEHELQIQKLEAKRKQAEFYRQASELETQALRAQMNPHFIFNSLNSINMFILENNKLQASAYLSKFSRLVRLILQNSQEAFIPLERELEALELYLELESLRFDNKFEYKIVVDDEVDTTVLRVPPLIIQPHVENAIWHGLMHKKEKGHLGIELYQQAALLICKVTDDGVGRTGAEQLKSKPSNKHKSMGIKITESRIAMKQTNGNDQAVEIRDLVYADGSAAGTEVLLKIPIDQG
jgi:LytS/YehU family sensor histidine kinase